MLRSKCYGVGWVLSSLAQFVVCVKDEPLSFNGGKLRRSFGIKAEGSREGKASSGSSSSSSNGFT